MRTPLASTLKRHLANAASILGVLPVCLLFSEGGYRYLIPLIVYNNIMDDLDGILAVQFGIESRLGAVLDNLCDAVAHTIFVLVVGMHYGGVCAGFAVAASVSIMLRAATRIDPQSTPGGGSPTNELMRHVLFVLLLASFFDVGPAPFLAAACALHAASMLTPYRMPFLIRGYARSTLAISAVNVALVAACSIPYALPGIAACFFLTYLGSFAAMCWKWLKRAKKGTPA